MGSVSLLDGYFSFLTCRISGRRARRLENIMAGQILGWSDIYWDGWTKVSIKDASGALEMK